MILTNTNINTLPFYSSRAEQWENKRYANYFPIYCPLNRLIPFQLICTNSQNTIVVKLFKKDGTEIGTLNNTNNGIGYKPYTTFHLLFCFGLETSNLLEDGQKYYLYVKKGTTNANEFYSEIFEASSKTSEMVKISYGNVTDTPFGDYKIMGTYQGGYFNFVSYIPQELGKSKYKFDKTIKNLEGIIYPMQIISSKEYILPLRATEDLLDALRLCVAFDKIKIEYGNLTLYPMDIEFSEIDWNDNGIGTLELSIMTDTIVRRLAPSNPTRGDFNDDFNNDFFINK